ncbi:MAG: hypothetical protein N4A31_00065 [Rickettsiales bacterium]|jgi:hypothetical protein|nr:hypothetical protein [Rickettsiales bacterium]
MRHLNTGGGNMINHEGIIMACEHINQFKKLVNAFKFRDDVSLEDTNRTENILSSLKEDLNQLSTSLRKTRGLVKNKSSDEKRELVTNIVYRLQDNFYSLKKDASLFIQTPSLKELDINKLSGPLSQAGLRIDFSKNPSRHGLSFSEKEKKRDQDRSSSVSRGLL